jgi:hypothetical protein
LFRITFFRWNFQWKKLPEDFHTDRFALGIDNCATVAFLRGAFNERGFFKMADDNSITFPVEATHIMMFARAIGDYSAEFHDADAAAAGEAGGIMAPPTFPQAVAQFNPDYHLRIKPGEAWFGSGKNPSGVEGQAASSGGLHAEQHFEFERPLRPGDVLTVTSHDGKTWEKVSKRAGKLMFSERVMEYRDQDGDLVCTARSVGVRTERPVDQG